MPPENNLRGSNLSIKSVSPSRVRQTKKQTRVYVRLPVRADT